MSSTAEELASQAEQLLDLVGFFNVDDGGNNYSSQNRAGRAAPTTDRKAPAQRQLPKPVEVYGGKGETAKGSNSHGKGVTIILDENGAKGDKYDDEFESY